MSADPRRHPREGFDLTVRAVALRRAGVLPVGVLAAVDQARASLAVEPDEAVARVLVWVCGVLEGHEPVADDLVVDSALRVAARELGPDVLRDGS